MPIISTRVKDTFLVGTVYLLIALAWFFGWSYLGMSWEFLAAPIMLILTWVMLGYVGVIGVVEYGHGENIIVGATVGTIVGAIVGAFFGAKVGAVIIETIISAIFGAIVGAFFGENVVAFVVVAIVGGIIGTISGAISGAIRIKFEVVGIIGAVCGAITGTGAERDKLPAIIGLGVVGGIMGFIIGAILQEVYVVGSRIGVFFGARNATTVGAIVGGITGTINGAINGTGFDEYEIPPPICGVVVGAILGVIVGAIFGATSGGIVRGIVGAIVGMLFGGTVGGTIGTILRGTYLVGGIFAEIFEEIGDMICEAGKAINKIIVNIIPSKDVWSRLSSYFLFPPFIFFLTFLFSQRLRWLTKRYFIHYSLAVFFTFSLSLFLICLFNKFFILFFKHTSQRERARWQYVSVYPNLFCIEHLYRPRKARRALFYSDATCRKADCPQEFVSGIKEVVGLIGGDITDYRQDIDRIYVSLWQEKTKKARNADIDVLEIIDSPNITYDYAINAVFNELINDVSRPRGYVKGIPVILRGNPSLPKESRYILEHEFGGIKE